MSKGLGSALAAGVAVLAVVGIVIFIVVDTDDADDPAETPTPGADDGPTRDATAPPDVALGDIEWSDCPFTPPTDAEVECGYLAVPELWDADDSDEVLIPFAVFAAENDDADAAPMVYLTGGPGQGALEQVTEAYDLIYRPLAQDRDLVLFDQRGTGLAEPSLACPEHIDEVHDVVEEAPDAEEAGERATQALLACRDRLLEEGVDFSGYNSRASAADMEALREGLGYDEWNVYGVSYGSRLALTAMREYPDGIRAAVLDSAYPLEANLYEETSGNVARGFSAFFASCEADEACSEAYPDLEGTFAAMVEELEEEPQPLTIFNPMTGDEVEATITGADMAGFLFQSLYVTDLIPLMPEMIDRASQGEFETIGMIQGLFLAEMELSSTGMQLAVQCQEEVPFSSREGVAEAISDTEMDYLFASSPTMGTTIFDLCDEWEAGDPPAAANEPVESDIPALVLAGEYDPITPPAWGEAVDASLANSHYFAFPHTGHGVVSSHECAENMLSEFLEDPGSQPDSACIGEIEGPAFTPGDAEVGMESYTNEAAGYAGARPADWTEIQPGIYQESPLVSMAQQLVPGATSEQMLQALAMELGLDAPPEPIDAMSTDTADWDIYQLEYGGQTETVAIAELEGQVALILLVATPAWTEAYYDEVLIPAVEAFELVEEG